MVMMSLAKIRESEDGHGESEAEVAWTLALMDPEGMPMGLLSSAERKGMSVLEKHAIVTVHGKGLGAMHALTQAAVRGQLTDQSGWDRLAMTVARALEES